MDRRNSYTGPFKCYYLEWVGWYNSSVTIRLLGHFRLYTLYKNIYAQNTTGLSPENAYILQCRENRQLKYTWIELVAFLTRFLPKGDSPREREAKSVNQILLHKHPDILQNFLLDAEVDFDKALAAAMEQIRDPRFLSASSASQVTLNIQEEHSHNTIYSKNEFNVQPVITAPPPRPAHGKEKGVFSKIQILILFDLLADAGMIDRIDLKYTSKTEDIAELMQAITGKPKSSWEDELKDYRTQGLYKYTTAGERQGVINNLNNLAEKFRNAGFYAIAKLADKKMREIERRD